MTVLYPETFKRNRPAGYDGLFDWDFLRPAFCYAPGKYCEPMDIDAAVERYGWKLGFETKSEGKPIPVGQMITIESLVRDGWTIIHCAKRPEEIRSFEVWRGQSHKIIFGDAARLVEFCGNWFQAASSNGHRSARFKPPLYGQVDCFVHQMTRLESAQDTFRDLSTAERAAFLAWAATLAGYNPRDDVELGL